VIYAPAHGNSSLSPLAFSEGCFPVMDVDC
jgi:hypothetical protein